MCTTSNGFFLYFYVVLINAFKYGIVESDTMQTFLYNDTLFSCTFDGYRHYGWSKLSE